MVQKADRAKLVQQYKEIPIEAGVYQIRNTVNGKIFLNSTFNLKSINGRVITLKLGTDNNRELQKDWNELGEQAFVFEVLEVLKKSDNPFVVPKDELKKMLDSWFDKLQPYGERGYHTLK
ncbi:GIY-YIG nuclease family protein [Cohnella abietis]|uniref:LuxR family transcriptional regulator n=1 Tax=Cohnella abietis TaxID=2507935 RepID=A0A3T1D6N6_9BACL|nr:GIY-YIG nuclease family protein [Cohnella abietis]BBI33748.1 hypothetical protein KCTCHS21_31470 [Cohnella abietis]